VATERRIVVHHARRANDEIETRVVASGRIELDPPGVAAAVEELFEE
jgi:hypothetical protein